MVEQYKNFDVFSRTEKTMPNLPFDRQSHSIGYNRQTLTLTVMSELPLSHHLRSGEYLLDHNHTGADIYIRIIKFT